MNITFLIGNGFDLNAGLDTTYSAFLKSYTATVDNDADPIKYFKKSILKDAEMWSNAEIAFGKATERFKTDGFTAEDFCVCHEDFCVQLAKYLQGQEQRINYTALKNVLIKGFCSGILKYKNGFRETEMNVISTSEGAFGGGYTFNFISFNYTSVIGICHMFLKENVNLLGKRQTSGGLQNNSCGKLMYVHGTVERDMVFGVNDSTQIADLSLFDGYDVEYINEIIKRNTNEVNEQNTDKKVFELLKTSDLIYIYGMSIGETDRLWWNRICQLMVQKSNLHVIIHRYDAPEDGLIRRSFRLFVNDSKKEFTAYSELEDDKKKALEARIHIDGTNIFDGLKNVVNDPANVAKVEETSITA